ncbi:MAG: ribose-phosphate diphosphokinase [Chloroflexi bacterium]|jgi:ribose-phosphate pyrophosphokinase|nr:ribose-phosphate diphosphokinase [Chloroflexota bacterium]
MAEHTLRIFSGNAHPELAQEIATILNVPMGRSKTTIFPDSETHVTIDEVVRGQDIFIVQPCSTPVNEHLMELLLYLDAFRRASVHSVSVLMPYFPYARQDRMAKGREAISARVVVNLLETLGADRVVYMDIHNTAIQGFFNIPVDPLSAIPVLASYFKQERFKNYVIVSPDVGRADVAGKYAELTDLPLVVMHKRRTSAKETHTTHVVGDIRGKSPIIIDDLMASGSVMRQLDALYNAGAVGKAYFSVTHPVLLPSAIQYLNEDDRIEKLVVTNTIHIPPEKRVPKLEIVSIAPLMAKIIDRIYHGTSLSDLLVLT